MRKYELMYIIRPDVEQEATKNLVEKFQNLITNNGGEIEKLDEIGKRRIAYEIEDFHEGYYVLTYFQSEPTLIAELERVLRITDGVIRYLIVKNEK